jgi:hypothetical protein
MSRLLELRQHFWAGLADIYAILRKAETVSV